MEGCAALSTVARRPTEFIRHAPTRHVKVPHVRTTSLPVIGVDAKYFDLVALSVPGARWWAGGPRTPITVFDAHEKLVAVVMPMLVACDECQKELPGPTAKYCGAACSQLAEMHVRIANGHP